MRLIDGEHLKRWILARWEETDPTSEYPLRAIEVINQIDRESEYLNINKAVKDAYKHGVSNGIKKGRAMAQPQRMRGEWIEDGYNHYKAVCSECGEPCATYIMGKPRDRFCKWCGADMRGDEDAAD